jgi:peptide/nickel transport system ATP-binding protein
VDLTVRPGRLTAVLGESGSGKSMLAAALTGSLPSAARSSGEVRVTGTVSLLPQDGVTAFAADETVGAQLRGLQRRHRGRTVEEASAAAAYPLDAAELYPRQHSGGQIQRAALAAALLAGPDLLVADEPSASLDAGTACEVWANLRGYAAAGPAVLAVTHDVELLTETGAADELVFLREGRIVAAGPPDSMRALADPYVQGFFRPFGQR